MAETFWTDVELEPKRAYKFTLTVAGGEIALPQFLIKKVSKPSFTISESEHKYLNHSFWYPGKVTWNTVAFTIADVIGESDGTMALMKMFQAAGYQYPTNPAEGKKALETISKKKAKEALGTVTIRQIDSEGNPVETWRLNNAWFQDVKFGDLDYDGEDLLNVEVTLRYDSAYIETLKSGGPIPENAPKAGS
jgi:hypothetical protein|tara:strand:+ start:146 stop:721 length:576 start_codon:yes stop_codon:yes gene_type:complete